MKILVTGGTGYIGSHTAVELINEGFEVVIFDNLSNSRIDVLDGIEKITGIRPAFEQIDLCDRSKTQTTLGKYAEIKAVIHFAAYKAVGESVEFPLKYYHNNIASLVNIMELMQQFSIPDLVFSSSCTVYGQPDVLPVTENAPVKPANSPYGATKQICEQIIRDTVNVSEIIKCISLRYFNPVGAHPSAYIGETPTGIPNNLVPFITQTAIGIRDCLSVFGDDYNTPDGSCIRDYINVVDLAKAHVTSVRRLIENRCKSNFEVFNVGAGKGVSVLEMIRAFEKAAGENLNYKIVDRRAGDIEQVWADTAYANDELGWKAVYTLDETLKSAWKWEKSLNSNFYK